MYAEETGQSFLVALLIGIAIGAIIGGISSGISAANAGLTGWNWVGATFAGALVGGALGAATVLGAGAVTGAIGGWTAFGIMSASTIGSGMASYTIEKAAYGQMDNWNAVDMFITGAFTFAKGLVAIGMGAVTGTAGLWNFDAPLKTQISNIINRTWYSQLFRQPWDYLMDNMRDAAIIGVQYA